MKLGILLIVNYLYVRTMTMARVFAMFAARLTWLVPTETLRKATWRLLLDLIQTTPARNSLKHSPGPIIVSSLAT